MKLSFSDGMQLDLSGPLRAEHKRDGWYLIGEGMQIPVADSEEARRLINRLKELRASRTRV